jgi:hypothetical protein
VLAACKNASHGAIVEPKALDWAMSVGPRLLTTLDYQLVKEEVERPEEKLEYAVGIIS